MPEIRIIRTGEDLAALQPQWWELWRRAAATPFLSPAWLLPWWQIFRPGELRSVAVLDGAGLFLLRLGDRCAGAYYGLSDGK